MSLILAALILSPAQTFAAEKATKTYVAPDSKGLVAIVGVEPTGESKISIAKSHGRLLLSKTFKSPDGEHGRVITHAEWTPNSRFFVFTSESSGGHSPLMTPVYYWDRNSNVLKDLDDFVGGISGGFSVSAPDIVHGQRVRGPNDSEPKFGDNIDFEVSLASASAATRRNLPLEPTAAPRESK